MPPAILFGKTVFKGFGDFYPGSELTVSFKLLSQKRLNSPDLGHQRISIIF